MKPLDKILSLLFFVSQVICYCQHPTTDTDELAKAYVFITPLGKEFYVEATSESLLAQYAKAQKQYQSNPLSADNIIWYGRRTAYLGNYQQAIEIFTEGIEKFPNDARFYRHRGHRYISIRKFDEAITDLKKAAELIKGTKNRVEPDGMPNAQNIPVSTLHGNIWYHLGLAYYLKHDYKKSFDAYINCRNSGTRDDNIVSSTHWLYMLQRRLGNIKEANKLLEPIKEDAEIIENHNYYHLCKFYKGILSIEALINPGSDNAASDATKYGLANWYFYNNEKVKSKALMEDIVNGKSWNSFGYIAAESDLQHYFK